MDAPTTEEKPVNIKAAVKDFMLETTHLQREAEINRVLKAFQFNPYVFLDH